MKKLLTILLLIMLIISFFQIANMYALYKDELQGQYTNLLGVWKIKVNGIDISSGEESLTFEMTEDNLQYVNDSNVKEGKIAPGSQACFKIAIDPTDTDVSILYELSIDQSSMDRPRMKLVRVENYFQKEGETEENTNEHVISTEDRIHTALIPLDIINQKYINYVDLYFEWENIEDSNSVDSELGKTEDSKISVPLRINLKQYTGVSGDET